MGFGHDPAVVHHFVHQQIVDSVADVEVALGGNAVRLNAQQRRVGDAGGVALDLEHHVDLAVIVLQSDRNTPGRAPDGALMVRGAQRIHDLGDVAPTVDHLAGHAHALAFGGI
jgi:hypothetical protein